MYDDVGYLISETETKNTIGDTIKAPAPRLVYVERKSIRQSEFYQAAASGLKPEIMFEMRRIEYQDEPKFKYENRTYTIMRTYEKDKDFIELICGGKVNGVK